jgi:Abnormal spindle-like microcephaly-assoc'd, ASPM-SPD-2-Hydin
MSRFSANRPNWCGVLTALLAAVTSVSCGVGSAQIGGNTTNEIPASLRLNTTNVNFGSLQVGKNKTSSIALTNTSASEGPNVTFSAVTVNGTGFTATTASMPIVLAPGATTKITVGFAPHAAGKVDGSLAIVVEGAQDPASVPLTGTGVADGQLAIAPSTLAFGSVATGSSKTLPATLTNSGGSSVTVAQATFSGGPYSVGDLALPLTLSAGQSVAFSATFAPPSNGADNFNLSLTSNASNATLTVPVTGSGASPGSLAASASSLNFGNVPMGSTQSLPETLSNAGGLSIVVTRVTAGPGYEVSGLSLPLTLAANQSVGFRVIFSPSAAGADDLNLTIANNGASPVLSIPLMGKAVAAGALTISPASFNFGSVTDGSSQSLPAMLTNTGGTSVTVTQVAFSGSSFTVNGLNLPVTLQGGQSISFDIVFTPKSGGSDSGNLAITSDASNPALGVSVSGSGVAPGGLTASASSLSFGKVTIGGSQVLPETLMNSGGSSITVNQITAVPGYTVSGVSLPLTLASGQSTSFNVTFSPQSAGSDDGSLALANSGPTATLTIPLSGTAVTPGVLSVSPINFGSVPVGSSTSQPAALSNSGGASLKISQANLTGSAYSMSGLNLPLTLTAGQNFTFTVTFAPENTGAIDGSIALVSDAAGSSSSMVLSGTGTAANQFSVTPGSFSFGSVAVGSEKNMIATLRATGSSVVVTAASVSNPEFALSGPALPLTIAAGSAASFTLTFTPSASGATAASVSFATNAPGSPTVESMSGSGTAVAQHSVDLSWSESSSKVAGYYVYRSLTSGGPYTKLDTSSEPTTSYTDNSVQAGQTYFYVTTSVGTDGMESSYSNQASGVIPTP